MALYKDAQNNIHDDMGGTALHLLPDGCVEVTDIEAEEIRIASIPAPTPPVYSCNPWQIRKVLNQIGLRQAVEDAVATSTDQTMKDGWEFATEFRSDDPFVQSMGAALGKTQTEIEQLIQLAATL